MMVVGYRAVGGNNQEAGSLDGDTTAQLSEQRRLQEDLTDDLLRMTTEMKQRTLLMSSTLVEDDKVCAVLCCTDCTCGSTDDVQGASRAVLCCT